MNLLLVGLTLLLLHQTLATNGYVNSRNKQKTQIKLSPHGVIGTHHGIQQRFNFKDKCWLACDSSVVGPLGDELLFYFRKELIAVLNETSSVALILDLKTSKGVLLDGYTGGGIIFSVTEGEGYIVKTGFWIEKKESFNSYFICLNTLEKLWIIAQAKGDSFSSKTISKNILVVIHKLLIVLSGKIAVDTKYNIDTVFTILIELSNKLITTWSGPLKWMLDGFIEGYKFQGGLVFFVGISEGLREFFGYIKGGVKVLIEANIKFDLKRILAARSGVEIYAIIFDTLSDKIDWSLIFGDNFSSVARLYKLSYLLGGFVQSGTDGLITVLGKVIGLVETSQPTVHKLAESLLRYSWKGGVNFTIFEEAVVIEYEAIKKQIAKYNNGQKIANYTVIIEGFIRKKFIVGGVDLYKIVERLQAVGKINGLRLSVQVLKLTSQTISINRLVSTLLLEIFGFLETTVEAEILARLIPTFRLEYDSNGKVAVIENIKKRLKLHDLKPVKGDLYQLLLRIPTIRKIIRFLDDVLKKEKLASLKVILRNSQSRSAAEGIAVWLQTKLNVTVNLKGITDQEEESGSNSGSSINSSSNSSSSSSVVSGSISVDGSNSILPVPIGLRSSKSKDRAGLTLKNQFKGMYVKKRSKF